VVEGDAERGILLVKGAVPGPNGSLVLVKNAAKKPVTLGQAASVAERQGGAA
jgi:large subunit ribosomal protein L3